MWSSINRNGQGLKEMVQVNGPNLLIDREIDRCVDVC